MDINSIKDLTGAGTRSYPKLERDKEFREVFECKISEVNSGKRAGDDRFKPDLLEHGSRIIDLLDDYARDLADPQKTLKHLEPMIKDISNEADLIAGRAAGSVNDDSGLRRLIEDIAVTAGVAAFKFNRGDYV